MRSRPLRSERGSSERKQHLVCSLCVPRVYESLQTSSPLFVDETGHGQRISARASRLHLHSSIINPKRVAECIARRPSVSKQCKRSFGGPASFLQGIPDSLFLSGTVVTSIPPNHSLDDITGSGSLTSPSPTPSKTTSDSRKEKAFALATLYLMILRLHER
ncbi:hypothetical protein BKA70DRAFT_344799 [Coprinopsis sp. MPI-PUGE-AT-0042]|nr:hypothetical protein BKA70DRAFT_344799 [Coprinopsis sp. MPI-PUGE-AT-0042]